MWHDAGEDVNRTVRTTVRTTTTTKTTMKSDRTKSSVSPASAGATTSFQSSPVYDADTSSSPFSTGEFHLPTTVLYSLINVKMCIFLRGNV